MHEYVYGQLSNDLFSKMSWLSFFFFVSLHSGKDNSHVIRKLCLLSGVVEGNSTITTKT